MYPPPLDAKNEKEDDDDDVEDACVSSIRVMRGTEVAAASSASSET